VQPLLKYQTLIDHTRVATANIELAQAQVDDARCQVALDHGDIRIELAGVNRRLTLLRVTIDRLEGYKGQVEELFKRRATGNLELLEVADRIARWNVTVNETLTRQNVAHQRVSKLWPGSVNLDMTKVRVNRATTDQLDVDVIEKLTLGKTEINRELTQGLAAKNPLVRVRLAERNRAQAEVDRWGRPRLPDVNIELAGRRVDEDQGRLKSDEVYATLKVRAPLPFAASPQRQARQPNQPLSSR